MNITKRSISSTILSIFLLGVGCLMILPMIWMISTSFKFESDVFHMPIQWIPETATLSNYISAITDFPYAKWYLNTITSTFWIVVLLLTISSMAGYAFAKLPVIGKNLIFFLFITTMMIPHQVRIIPQFMMFQTFGLINTQASIIVGWSYSAFAIFMMRQFFMSIPDDLLEAARIDGSGETYTFFKIVMPIAKAQLSALGILAFTWGWNQYFGPLIFINKKENQILSVGISMFKSTYTNNYAIQMAGASLALIPIIIVYLLAQKQFVEGIALSGVKG